MAGRLTRSEIPDLSGRIAVVTGANSGIGFETALGLTRGGARTILACRDRARGAAALSRLRSESPNGRAEVMELDLASLEAIRAFTEAFEARHDRLDILVNSAGVLFVPYGTTTDGFERHLGINHLGHFALTGRLMDRLLATAASRVVTVSSRGHGLTRLDPANLQSERGRGYSAIRAYARSKLANLLFTYELQRRLDGTGTIAVAAHPGGAPTGLGRRMVERPVYRAFLPLMEWLSQSAAAAAGPVLRAATDPGAEGGEYYGPSGLLGMRGGPPIIVRSSRRSYDEDAARRLWDASEELTGVRYP